MDDTSDLRHVRDRTNVDYQITNKTSSVTSNVTDQDVVLTQTPIERASTERAPVTSTNSHQAIEYVREDMKVIDVNGDDIGKVAAIKMGDPDTATVSAAEQLPDDTLIDQPLVAAPLTNTATGVLAAPIAPAAAFDDEDSIDPNLVRNGYIRVDAKGWFKRDLLVPADAITSVAADTVTISLAKDELAKE